MCSRGSTGQGEEVGGRVEGLVPEEAPVEEEAGNQSGRKRVEVREEASGGRTSEGRAEEGRR